MNRIEKLLQKFCPDGVEFKALQDICALRAGDRIIKSMMKDNEKYPVMGGGVMPTGYYKNYNFSQGITIARAGSAGFVSWQENPFWATDVCFVATFAKFDKVRPSLRDTSKASGVAIQNKNIDCHEFADANSRNDINLKFIYYFLKTSQSDLQKHLYGASMPKLDKAYLWNLKIPIPPLEIQKEIVLILDAFTELQARQKQYEHYRERLLSFDELVSRSGGGDSLK